MLPPSVLDWPFAWPTSPETPKEHLFVLGCITEEQHLALAESHLTIGEIATATQSTPVLLMENASSADVQGRVRFFAATGWDTAVDPRLYSVLCDHEALARPYAPHIPSQLAASGVSVEWVEAALYLGFDLTRLTQCAADGLPVEYLREMADV